MNLCYTLPEIIQQGMFDELGSQPEICLPMDLSQQGERVSGWLAATRERIAVRQGESLTGFIIQPGQEYTAEVLVGNGILLVKQAGHERILARFTMHWLPRYAAAAKFLTHFSQGIGTVVVDHQPENQCGYCKRPLRPGSRVCPHCRPKAGALGKLWRLAKPYRWTLLACLASIIMLAGISLINPYIHRMIIDNVLLPRQGTVGTILGYVAVLAAMSLGMLVFQILRGRLMVKVGTRISHDLRSEVFAHLQELSMGYLSQRKTGDLMHRVTGDTDRIRDFIEMNLAVAVTQIITLIAVLGMLIFYDWQLTILIMLPAPFVIFFSVLRRKKIHHIYQIQWRLYDRANSLLQDILSGMRVVKTFGREKREIARFEYVSGQFARRMKYNEQWWNTVMPILSFALGLGYYMLLGMGGAQVQAGELPLGQLVQMGSYVGMIYGPMMWFSHLPRMIAQTFTAVERVYEILDEKPEVSDEQTIAMRRIEGRVDFDQVTFGYQSYDPVLKDITLSVEPGEMVGLVGLSGTGKSTMINLVMRLYDTQEGSIRIDGIDIRQLSQEDLHQQIGVVLQETFLFSGTLLDNIRYAHPKAGYQEVITAAKIANAHDFITKLPDGYDTWLNENGRNLSGGERQRIAIARAILHNPRILILDEATSSLDTESEQLIQDALQKLVAGRTTFAIAHRLSTLRHADRLVVLDKNRISQIGTHEELMALKSGLYYELVMAQRTLHQIIR